MLKKATQCLFIVAGLIAYCGTVLAAEIEGVVEPSESSTYWELLRYGWQINIALGVLAFFGIFIFKKNIIPGEIKEKKV